MKQLVKQTIVVLSVIVLVAAFVAGPAAAKPLKIRIGYVHVPSELQPVMFKNKSVLKHDGKSYTLDFTPFRGTGLMIQGLAAKEIDIATLAFNSFETAVNNAKLDIKIIIDNFQDGKPGYYTGIWGVLSDSGISSVKDLRGKRFAVPAINTAVDIGMRAVMRNAGMKAGKDYHVVEVKFPNMEVFLREKKVDVSFFAQAFWARATHKGGVKEIFKMTDAFGGVTQFVFRVARTDYLKKNRAVVVDFIEDHVRALRHFRNPKNREASVTAAAKYYKLPERAIKPWLLAPGKDYYRDLNAYINVGALQSNLDDMFKMGFSKKRIDVKEYWAHEYLDEALKRVGRVTEN